MPESSPQHFLQRQLVPDEQQPWQTLSSQQLSPAPHVLLRDTVLTGHGTQLTYTYRPRGPMAVFVLPITQGGEAVLIRQYRYPLRAWVWEVVAGGVESGEELLGSAARELHEEVGGAAAQWLALPAFYPQPSVSGAAFYPFVAFGVTLQKAQLEADELIERHVLPLSETYRMLDAGEILAGPSALTLYQARVHLQARGLL